MQSSGLLTLGLGAVVFASAAVPASGALYTDDFNTDSRSNYSTAAGREAMNYSATAGLGGSGALTFTTSGATGGSLVSETSVGTFAQYPTITGSVFIKSTGSTGTPWGIGFTNASGTSPFLNQSYPGDIAGVGAWFMDGRDGTTPAPRIRQNDNSGSYAQNASSSLSSAWGSAWFEFELSVTHVANTTYEVTGTIYNRGSDGTAARTQVWTSGTQTWNNPHIEATDPIYVGFGARSNHGTVDNLTVVPEPASLGLLGLGGLALLRRRSV
jgi:hypothetical protein